MGVDYHGLCFLQYAKRNHSFGRVATMGRQSLYVNRAQIRRITGLPDAEYRSGEFCEEMLKGAFGASLVHSFDASDFESATFICDLNQPLTHEQQYDTVLDYGTSEHVFNVAQALQNIISLCAPGGQIIHALPADNCNGHGFWQFSPELFFSLYSERNGFSDTEVFLAEIRDWHFWYQVAPPSGGRRSEFSSRSQVYVLVRTTRREAKPSFTVQQSDYVDGWATGVSQQIFPPERDEDAQPGKGLGARVKAAIDRYPELSRKLRNSVSDVQGVITDLRSNRYLSRRSGGFRQVPIGSLLG